MRLIFSIIFLALNCLAADQSNKSQKLCTTENAPEQHLCAGDNEERSDELMAYAIGCFFASEVYNPIFSVPDIRNPVLFVSYGTILGAFSNLSPKHSEFIKQKLDFDQFKKLIHESCNNRSSLLGSFGELRWVLVQSAKDEFAIVAFEVAILKWVVRSLAQGGKPSLLFPLISSNEEIPRPLLGLELFSNIARLCRRELDVLFDGLVAHYQTREFKIREPLFTNILNYVITMDKESVAERLLPIIVKNYVDNPVFPPMLIRYVQLWSPSTCPYASKVLEGMIGSENQPQIPNEFDLKIWVDHDMNSNFVWMTSESTSLQKKMGSEFVLQAEIVGGNISWTTEEFVGNSTAKKIGTSIATHEHLRKLYVICPRRPPSSLTKMLINQCQTEEGMKELLKSSKFKYLTMAFGVTMFEASHIKPRLSRFLLF